MLQQTWQAAIKKMFPKHTAHDWSDIDLAFIPDFGQMDSGDLNLGGGPVSPSTVAVIAVAANNSLFEQQQQQEHGSHPTLFWDSIIQRDHYNHIPLSLHTQRSLKLLLCAAHDLLGIHYAPIVPDMITLLYYMMPDSYVYATLRTMIRTPNQNYFTTSKDDQIQIQKDFIRCLKTLYPSVYTTLDQYSLLSSVALSPIFHRFFVTIFRHEHLLELLNLFLVDNMKLVFRVGVTLLSTCILEYGLRLEDIPTSSPFASATYLWQAIRSYTRGCDFSLDDFLQKAYSFHDNWFILASIKGLYDKDVTLSKVWTNLVSRMDRFLSTASLYSFTSVEKGYNRDWASKRLASMEGGEELAHILQDVEPIQILPSIHLLDPDTRQPIPSILAMTSSFRFHLTQWLPLSMQAYNIQLIFTTSIHGRSLDTLLTCVKNISQSLILIEVLHQTSRVIGMYASHTWSIQPRPFGDGTCFLFRASPNPACFKWKPLPSSTSSTTSSKMQALSTQYMVAKHEYIAMGGNDQGGYGLHLNSDLSKGHSSKAVSFDNDPLAGENTQEFDIGLVEVYKFVREGDRKANVSYVNGSWSVSGDANN